MGTKTSIGLGLALLLMVLAVVLRFGIADPTEIDAAKKEASANTPAETENTNQKTNAPLLDKTKGIPFNHPNQQHSNNATKVYNPLDHMSPEMKQSLRDQLLQHGTGETFTKDDGTVVLPSQGRATQVSVAVQMPDGTIQIREYSEIPDEQAAPTFTLSEPSK